MSQGHGGGTRLENALGSGDYTPDGQVDFKDSTKQTQLVGCLYYRSSIFRFTSKEFKNSKKIVQQPLLV